ncbi:MAG: hypothetical protein ACQESP_13020 [Candidatus Muiribacteriota bacterium]
MRGNVNYQVQLLYKEVEAIGESKHQAKEEARLQAEDGKLNWHDMGKELDLYCYKTADTYRATWDQLGHFVKQEFSIHDLEKINGEHVQSFLEYRINLDTVNSYDTFSKEASALEKLERALNSYSASNDKGNQYAFSANIRNAREDAKLILDKFSGNRAYTDTKSLIDNIKNETHQVIAQAQKEGGFRISELNHLREKNFNGITKDPITGQEKGSVYIEQSKGGRDGEKLVSIETYNKLKEVVQNSKDQILKFSDNSYRNSLKNSANITNQEYTRKGSHGLRYNFAQERFQEVQRSGQSFDKALQQVSQEMFHTRPDITLHYVKH